MSALSRAEQEWGISQWLRTIDPRIKAMDWNDRVAQAQIPLDLLYVDPRFQRSAESTTSVGNIRGIVGGFEPERFGSLQVNVRADLTLSVVDGQHRVIAMRQAGRGRDLFPALVSFGASVGEEARWFRLQRENSKLISHIEFYRAGLVEGNDPESAALNSILEPYGYRIAATTAPNVLRCIQSIKFIWKTYGEATLLRVVETLRATWGDDVQGVDNVLMKGMGRFFVQYNQAISQPQLEKALVKTTPRQVREMANGMSQSIGTDRLTSMVNAMVKTYNGRAAARNRLPGFMARTPFDYQQWLQGQEG